MESRVEVLRAVRDELVKLPHGHDERLVGDILNVVLAFYDGGLSMRLHTRFMAMVLEITRELEAESNE